MTIDRQTMCDDDILHLLADQPGRTVAQMADHFHVSKTAICKRLARLMLAESVTRRCEAKRRRSRPEHTYYLPDRGDK